MGLPQTPQESAPSYDELFHDHPVNGHPPSGSASSYLAVSQSDDVELESGHTHTTDHPRSSSAPPQQESLAQTIAGVFRPKPHVHCEQCDVQLAAREEQSQQRHCCAMVSATFMVAFVCVMVLGIVIVKSNEHRRDRYDV